MPEDLDSRLRAIEEELGIKVSKPEGDGYTWADAWETFAEYADVVGIQPTDGQLEYIEEDWKSPTGPWMTVEQWETIHQKLHPDEVEADA